MEMGSVWRLAWSSLIIFMVEVVIQVNDEVKAFNVKKASIPADQNPVAVLTCRRFGLSPYWPYRVSDMMLTDGEGSLDVLFSQTFHKQWNCFHFQILCLEQAATCANFETVVCLWSYSTTALYKSHIIIIIIIIHTWLSFSANLMQYILMKSSKRRRDLRYEIIKHEMTDRY